MSLHEEDRKSADASETDEHCGTTNSLDHRQESLTDDKMANVRKVFPALQKLDAWDADGIANFFGKFMEENNLKLGQFGPVMRNILTGTGSPLGVYDLLLLLGKEESLARLEDILAN